MRRTRHTELDELLGRTTGLLGHRVNYSLCLRGDNAGTSMVLYHLHNYHRAHSLSVMTDCLTGLLGHGNRHSYCRGSRTFQGLRGRSTGRMEQQADEAGVLVHRYKQTTRPRNLSGAGRRVSPSPMHGSRSQTTCYGRRGTGWVLLLLFQRRFFLGDNQ